MTNYDVWQMIGVLVTVCTLPLLVSSSSKNFVFTAYIRIRGAIRPYDVCCKSLRWSDIPSGRIHICDNCTCTISRGHDRQKSCWEGTISGTFNVAAKNINWVNRPPSLAADFDTSFIRIDVRTLVAYLLCCAPEKSSLEWRPRYLLYEDQTLDASGHEGTLVAHISDFIQQHALTRTKNELEKVISGYPPFFRDFVALDHGPVLRFPIRDQRDIPRGGWVIMVGMMDTNRYKPLPLYTVPQHGNFGLDGFVDGTHIARTIGKPFRMAVARVEEVVQLIGEYFPEDESLKMVLEALQYMLRTGTGSGVECYLPWAFCYGSGPIQTGFDANTCRYIMGLFNELKPLQETDVNRLKPILDLVLQTAFRGSYKIIQYLKDTGMRLDLPDILRTRWDRSVYLRDCQLLRD